MTLNEVTILLFLIIILLTAVVSDFGFYKIPNSLTYTAMIVAIVYHTYMKGLAGFLFSIEGIGVGIAIMIIPYLMGGMGAGKAQSAFQPTAAPTGSFRRRQRWLYVISVTMLLIVLSVILTGCGAGGFCVDGWPQSAIVA